MAERVKESLESLDAMDDISFLDSSNTTSDKTEQYDIAVDIVLDILDSLIRHTLDGYDDKSLILLLSSMTITRLFIIQ